MRKENDKRHPYNAATILLLCALRRVQERKRPLHSSGIQQRSPALTLAEVLEETALPREGGRKLLTRARGDRLISRFPTESGGKLDWAYYLTQHGGDWLASQSPESISKAEAELDSVRVNPR